MLGGCEIEKVAIPRTSSQLSMHSVLSASAPSQVVLLERTRNGSVTLFAPPFDVGDPVVSDKGIAETDAEVTLTLPDGTTLFAREDKYTYGRGEGVYRFSLPGSALVRGATYRLRARTILGNVVTAETSVPQGEPATVAEQRVFDRSRDTLVVEWPAAPGARSYFVRIESPFGPRYFFTDSTRVRLTGELRNANTTALRRVFVPGFPQAVTVSAVDSNYYDWYRTQNNEITGTGLVNRVQGGFGVFGALVRLRFAALEVVTPQTEPAAGVFRYAGTPEDAAGTPYLSVELYVESKAARSDQADALSGRIHARPRLGYTGCLTCGVLGTVKNGRVELGLLSGWSAKDTAEVFRGEIRGDTIVGSYDIAGGVVRFVRQR
ncbi:MAG: DUF4249 family protein [Gemmatimonadaceae bacterium]